MPIYYRPASNNERQRQFRKRNAGYFKKYNVRTRRTAAEREAARAAMAALLAPEANGTAPAPLALPAPPAPAPAVVPVTAGVNTINTTPASIAA